MMKFKMTKKLARLIAEKNVVEYLTADWGWYLVSDWESPTQAYLQQTNTYSQAGDVFRVQCPGFNNSVSDYCEGWDSKGLSEKECIERCYCDSNLSDEIRDLAEEIYTSANEANDIEEV